MARALFIGRLDAELMRAVHVGGKIARWRVDVGDGRILDQDPDSYDAVLVSDRHANVHSFSQGYGNWIPGGVATQGDPSWVAAEVSRLLKDIDQGASADPRFGNPEVELAVSDYLSRTAVLRSDASIAVLLPVGRSAPKLALGYTNRTLPASGWTELLSIRREDRVLSAVLEGRCTSHVGSDNPRADNLFDVARVVGLAPVMGESGDVVGIVRITDANLDRDDLERETGTLAGVVGAILRAGRRDHVGIKNALLTPDGLSATGYSRDQLLKQMRSVSTDMITWLGEDPDRALTLRPRDFEEIVAEMYARRGFEVALTAATRDGGADIHVTRHDEFGSALYLVECKRWAPDRPVGVEVVRSLHGVVDMEGATAGVVVATSRFTSPAQEFRARRPYRLGLQQFENLVRSRTSRG